MGKVRNEIFHKKYHLYYISTRIIFLHKNFSQQKGIVLNFFIEIKHESNDSRTESK